MMPTTAMDHSPTWLFDFPLAGQFPAFMEQRDPLLSS